MFLKLRTSKGQGITEYAIMCAAVISGVMAMQAYVKRGVEGRIKNEMEEFSGIGNLDTQHEQMQASYSGEQTSRKTVNAELGGGSFNSRDVASREIEERY